MMTWRKPKLQEETYDHDYALRLIAEEGGGEKYLQYLRNSRGSHARTEYSHWIIILGTARIDSGQNIQS